MLHELLALIKEHPDLPVVPMVEGEVCWGDEYYRYMGEFGFVKIGEYALFDDRVFFDREEFKEEVYCRYDDLLDDRFKRDEQRLEAYLNKIAERAFVPAIIVYIDAASVEPAFDAEYYIEHEED